MVSSLLSCSVHSVQFLQSMLGLQSVQMLQYNTNRELQSVHADCCAGALNCDMPAANKGRYRVVVIGAGVSGLSAAHQLMRRGICDVLVVEALDRMGGRVKQVRCHDPAGLAHSCFQFQALMELTTQYLYNILPNQPLQYLYKIFVCLN